MPTRTWLEAVVAASFRATPEIAVLELAPAAGERFPAYTAGAHIDVLIRHGLIRQYSLCGPHESARYRLAVLREPASRGGSRTIHALKAGDRLRISAPRNSFPLTTARHHVLFAGGIGITPLLAMARQLDRDGGDYTLHYCVRNQARAAFAEELAGNPRVALHFDDGDPGQQLDLARDLGEPRPHTAIYVCGPGGFTDFVLDKARARGWPPHTLHTERFNTDPAPPASSGKQPGGFTVRVASSGAEYFVPEDRSVLDVLLDNGIDAPYSCQQGICGECAVRALHGILDHRDNVLTDSEHAEGLFTTCSSRVLSPLLELDL